jgi:hypothetical protein
VPAVAKKGSWKPASPLYNHDWLDYQLEMALPLFELKENRVVGIKKRPLSDLVYIAQIVMSFLMKDC